MIGLRYGLPNLIVTDAGSKFNSEFEQRCNLLNVKHHKAARNHNNSVLVKIFIRFMSTSLTVSCSDRDSIRVFIEGAAMVIYAWNLAPVAITNLSRSLVACGREFRFPINFTQKLHRSGINQPIHVKSYATDLFKKLEKSQEIYKVLISEHRALHQEIRNTQKTITRKFDINDIFS